MTSDRFDRGQLLTTIETISWSKNSLNQLFTCLLISLVKRAKPLFSRNFCEKCVRENLCNFSIHTVAASQCGKTRNSLSSIFLSFNSLVTYLVNVKPLLSRNFCQKCVRENYRNFHTVEHWQFRESFVFHRHFARSKVSDYIELVRNNCQCYDGFQILREMKEICTKDS